MSTLERHVAEAARTMELLEAQRERPRVEVPWRRIAVIAAIAAALGAYGVFDHYSDDLRCRVMGMCPDVDAF